MSFRLCSAHDGEPDSDSVIVSDPEECVRKQECTLNIDWSKVIKEK